MKDLVVLKLACRGLTMCYSVLKLYGKSCSIISTELYQKKASYLELYGYRTPFTTRLCVGIFLGEGGICSPLCFNGKLTFSQ